MRNGRPQSRCNLSQVRAPTKACADEAGLLDTGGDRSNRRNPLSVTEALATPVRLRRIDWIMVAAPEFQTKSLHSRFE
jgi:hypothetical protein